MVRTKTLPSIALAVALALAVVGCAARTERELDRAMAAAAAVADPAARYAALLRIDEQFPDRLQVKSELGWAGYLATGDATQALIHLEQARPLATARNPASARAQLFTRLATLELKAGDIPAALADATMAMVLSEDELSPALLRAHALAAAGRSRDAAAGFAQRWAERDSWQHADVSLFLQLVLRTGGYRESLAVFDYLFDRFGFDPALGFDLAVVHEQLGELDNSVLVAALSAEHAAAGGAPDDLDALLLRLTALQATLVAARDAGDAAARDGTAIAALSAVRQFFAGNYEASVAALQQLPPRPPYTSYFGAVAALEAPVSDADQIGVALVTLAALEPLFEQSAIYYLRLWRGMRRVDGYDFASGRVPLERVIELAPQSAAAFASRRELGRLLGLPPAAADQLVLEGELASLLTAAPSAADRDAWRHLVALLALPDNPYTAAAVVATRSRSSTTPQLRALLVAERQRAAAPLSGRLDAILDAAGQ